MSMIRLTNRGVQTVDNLLPGTVVLADGNLVMAAGTETPDLFGTTRCRIQL